MSARMPTRHAQPWPVVPMVGFTFVVLGSVSVTGCISESAGSQDDEARTSTQQNSSPTSTTPSVPTSSAVPTPRVFDDAAVQDAVHRMLREEYEIEELEVVTCPPGQPVEAETTFTCSATVAGAEQDVPITVTSDDGDYTVGRPE